MFWFAVVGLISGILSIFGSTYFATPFSGLNIFPGFIFGVSMSIALARRTSLKKLFLFATVSTIAFVLAYFTGFATSLLAKFPSANLFGEFGEMEICAIFFLSGFVGTMVLSIGVRTISNINLRDTLLFILIGALLGFLGGTYISILYPLWQAGMATMIGYFHKKSQNNDGESDFDVKNAMSTGQVVAKKGIRFPVLAATSLIVIVACRMLWSFYSVSGNSKLTNSESSDLLSYLNRYSLQAVVVRKVYKPNGQATWLLKSDGKKILLDNRDLGRDGWGVREYNSAVYTPASGAYIFMDQARVAIWDSFKNLSESAEVIDISGYVSGHRVDPTLQNREEWEKRQGHFWSWQNSGLGFSPDGNYMVDLTDELGYSNGPGQFFRLNKVKEKDGHLSYEPISIVPGSSYLWSLDSRYLFLKNYKKTFGIYQVNPATTTYLPDKITRIPQVKNGSSLIATGTFNVDGEGGFSIKKDSGAVIPFAFETGDINNYHFLDTNIAVPQGIGIVGFVQ